MARKNISILYAIGNWYNNRKVKTLVIYKGKNGNVELVAKSRYGNVVYRKRLRLIGQSRLDTQFWRATGSHIIEESLATPKEVDAYFARRKKKRKKRGSKYDFKLEDAIQGGVKINELLDDANFWSEE